MKRRRLSRWVLWFLPLLAVRALIPAGFMLSAESGAAQIVLCSGSGPAAFSQLAPTAAHEHHHPDGGQAQHHHRSGPGAHDRSVCPFALAAMAYLPGVASAISLLPPSSGAPLDHDSHKILFSDPIPIDRIRGPPLA